jgi:diguanylate cyclase (GGDEF)-like protein
MELKLFFRMLQRGWWIIIVTAVAATSITLAYDFFTKPTFRSTARFIVAPNPKVFENRDLIDSMVALDKRSMVSTFAEVLTSINIRKSANDTLQIPYDVLNQYKFSSTVLADANIIEYHVDGPDPRTASSLASTVGSQAIDYFNKLYQVYEIEFIDQASLPLKPIKPTPLTDAGIAIVLGFLVGIMLAIILDQLRVPLEVFRERRMIDNISGAYNRKHFEQKLEDEIVGSSEKQLIFSVGLVELTGLKGFIDSLPAQVSNNIITQVGQILRKTFKGNDIIGRWNDYTFAVILPSTPYKAATSILNRIRYMLDRPLSISQDGETIHLYPYVGVARSQESESMKLLLTRVEKDLDDAKAAGIPPQKPPIPQKPEHPQPFISTEEMPPTLPGNGENEKIIPIPVFSDEDQEKIILEPQSLDSAKTTRIETDTQTRTHWMREEA